MAQDMIFLGPQPLCTFSVPCSGDPAHSMARDDPEADTGSHVDVGNCLQVTCIEEPCLCASLYIL